MAMILELYTLEVRLFIQRCAYVLTNINKMIGTNSVLFSTMENELDNFSNVLFILSICSKRLLELFNSDPNLSFLSKENKYDFVILKNYEINNLIFFDEANNASDAEKIIDNRIFVLKQTINLNKKIKIRFQYYEKLEDSVHLLEKYLTSIYIENKSFYRAVNNQIFQNLHPKLKRKGIKNSRDKKIETLAPFLIAELAVLLFYTQTRKYGKVLSTCKPMKVFEQILSGRYISKLELSNKHFFYQDILTN